MDNIDTTLIKITPCGDGIIRLKFVARNVCGTLQTSKRFRRGDFMICANEMNDHEICVEDMGNFLHVRIYEGIAYCKAVMIVSSTYGQIIGGYLHNFEIPANLLKDCGVFVYKPHTLGPHVTLLPSAAKMLAECPKNIRRAFSKAMRDLFCNTEHIELCADPWVGEYGLYFRTEHGNGGLVLESVRRRGHIETKYREHT